MTIHHHSADNATTGAVAYDVPADAMWAVVSSFSGSWINETNSPASVKDVVGEGVGATRTVFMRDGSGEWGEEITAMDAAGMSWSYKILSALPGPFSAIDHTKFVCTMSVAKKGDGCEVTIGSTGVPPAMAPMLNGMWTAWTVSMAELAAKTNANFFVIQHKFKAGKAEEWWGNFGKMASDPSAMAAMTKSAHDRGFHNHGFLPQAEADGIVHCVWEARAGKTVGDMQVRAPSFALDLDPPCLPLPPLPSLLSLHSLRCSLLFTLNHLRRPLLMAPRAPVWDAWKTRCLAQSTPPRPSLATLPSSATPARPPRRHRSRAPPST